VRRVFLIALLLISGSVFSDEKEQALQSKLMRIAPNYMAEIAKADQEKERCYLSAQEGDCDKFKDYKSKEYCKIKFDSCTEENKAAYEKSALNHKDEYIALFLAGKCVLASFQETPLEEYTEEAGNAAIQLIMDRCYSVEAKKGH